MKNVNLKCLKRNPILKIDNKQTMQNGEGIFFSFFLLPLLLVPPEFSLFSWSVGNLGMSPSLGDLLNLLVY